MEDGGPPSPKRPRRLDREEDGDAPGETAAADDGAADNEFDQPNDADAYEEIMLAQADVCQQHLDQVNEECSDRVLEVEQEFAAKRRPLYLQRGAVLAKIPRFWRQVLLHHPIVAGLLTFADEAVLDFLSEVDVDDEADIKTGFKIKMTFEENPFFENTELVKELHFAEDGRLTAHCSPIQWRPGKAPADPSGEGGGGGVGSKRAAPDGDEEAPDYNLFAHWFTDELEGVMAGHDDLADVIKDDIWPDPVRWYRAPRPQPVGPEGLLDEDEDEFEDDGGELGYPGGGGGGVVLEGDEEDDEFEFDAGEEEEEGVEEEEGGAGGTEGDHEGEPGSEEPGEGEEAEEPQ